MSSSAPQFISINSSVLSFLYSPTLTSIHDQWKNHSFDWMDLCCKVMSLLFNMLLRFVIAFLPRSKHQASLIIGLPGGSDSKESAYNAGDLGSISGLGRSPGEGKGYLLQYSCLENSMDRIVHGVAKSWPSLRHI